MNNTKHRLIGAATVLGLSATLGLGTQAGAVGAASPDRIVFSVPFVGSTGEIPNARTATIAPDGTAEFDIDPGVPLESFNRTVWSHDATRLLYSNALVLDQNGDLLAFRPAISAPDGTGFRVLTLPELPADMYCSAWSLDDARLVCADADRNLISMRASDGGGRTLLTQHPVGMADQAVGFSPANGRLAFLRTRLGSDAAERTALFVARSDGSRARQITEWGKLLSGDLQSANWSPDGRSLIATNRHGTLVEVAADGSSVSPIHLSLGDTGTTFAVTPDYSPDGSRIVFALFQRSEADLYVASRDGSNAHAITSTPDFSEWFPDWR